MIGLGFIGAGLSMTISEASRDAYHAYLISQNDKKEVRFAEGRSKKLNFKTSVFQKGSLKNNEILALRFKQRGKNFRNSRKNFSIPNNDFVSVEKIQRTVSTSFRGVNKNKSKKVVRRSFVKNVQPKNNIIFKSQEEENYILNLPEGSEKVSENVFISSDKKLKVEVKSFPVNVCSRSFGFMGCGVKISKNENRKSIKGQGSIYPKYGIVRQSGKSDTVLGEVNIQTPTYTEQFVANFPNGKEFNINRYMVKTQKGEVYLLETKVDSKSFKDYLGIHKNIFDSFRVK